MSFWILQKNDIFYYKKISIMEIKEIVSYFLNAESNILEVSFRTFDDEDDVVRTDNIDYSITEEYGFVYLRPSKTPPSLKNCLLVKR